MTPSCFRQENLIIRRTRTIYGYRIQAVPSVDREDSTKGHTSSHLVSLHVSITCTTPSWIFHFCNNGATIVRGLYDIQRTHSAPLCEIVDVHGYLNFSAFLFENCFQARKKIFIILFQGITTSHACILFMYLFYVFDNGYKTLFLMNIFSKHIPVEPVDIRLSFDISFVYINGCCMGSFYSKCWKFRLQIKRISEPVIGTNWKQINWCHLIP